MSACNIMQQPGRGMVHMFTDGAATNRDGTLHSVQSKVRIVGDGIAAYGFRGGVGPWVEWIGERLERFDTFDAMIAAASVEAYRCHSIAVSLMPGLDTDDRKMEITFIGWSESADEPQAWFLSADPAADGNDHLKPFEIERLDMPRGAPPTPDTLETLGLPPSPTWADINALDPITAGIAWVTRQRHSLDGACPFHMVGGFVEMTTTTADGILRAIVKRWPDEVGKPLTP